MKLLPNLRRISVPPWSDIAKCAEQIEDKYVLSWRPNPSSHVSVGWDPKFIRNEIREGMKKAGDCYVDITLKDVLTVRKELWRLRDWVKIVNETCAEFN